MNQNELWNDFYRKNPRPWRGNNKIPVDEPCRVLDIGCGNGKTISTLLDAGCTVAGIDFSEIAVESCKKLFGDRCELTVADACNLPFGDGTFGLVTMVHVIENISDSDMAKVSEEVMRVLAPGGKVFVRTFTKSDMRSEKKDSGDIAYHPRDPDEIVSLFGNMKCLSAEKVEEKTRFGGLRSRSECLFVRR